MLKHGRAGVPMQPPWGERALPGTTVTVADTMSADAPPPAPPPPAPRRLFVFRCSQGSIMPFLSMYLKHCGWDPQEIGMLLSIRPIVSMLSAPIWGGLADRTGKKKAILTFIFAMSCVCRLSIRFTHGSYVTLAISLLSMSVFYSATMSLLDNIVVSSLSEKERSNFGKMRLWGELGTGSSSIVMMYAVNNFERGFDFLFLGFTIISSVTLVCIRWCTPEDKPRGIKEQQNDVNWKDGLRLLFGNLQMLAVFSLVVVCGYSLSFLQNYVYINMHQLYKTFDQADIAGRDTSFFRIAFAIGGVAAYWFSGVATVRFGPDAVMCAAVSCLPFCFFLYGGGVGEDLDGWTKAGFFLAEFLRSGVYAALWSTATIRIHELSPSNMTSVMQALMESAYRGLGDTSGSYFGGVLCNSYGSGSAAFMAAGKSLLTFLLIMGSIASVSPKMKRL